MQDQNQTELESVNNFFGDSPSKNNQSQAKLDRVLSENVNLGSNTIDVSNMRPPSASPQKQSVSLNAKLSFSRQRPQTAMINRYTKG